MARANLRMITSVVALLLASAPCECMQTGVSPRTVARVASQRRTVLMHGGVPPPPGNGHRRGFGGSGRDDDEGSDDGHTVMSLDHALAEAGLAEADVPADVLEALATGRVRAEELRNLAEVLSDPVLKLAALVSTALRDRLMANPHLARVIGVETVVGVLTMLSAEVKSRGPRLREELDFVACDLALIVATNMALVVSLSPAAAVANPTGALQRRLASLPATFLQPGRFSPAQRLASYGLNAARFGAIGVLSSAVGASTTKALIRARHRLAGTVSEVELAPVRKTCLAYGGFVSLSSSTRYQLVNALEQSVFPNLPLSAAALSVVTRTANNFAGGMHWISWAHWAGVQ